MSDNQEQINLQVVNDILSRSAESTYSLVLTDARISALPPDIGRFVNLDSLHLSGNRLESLPDEISRLSKLRQINLSNNHFREIPEVLLTLPALEIIRIGNNRIRDLPPRLADIKKWSATDLAGNPLRDPLPDLIERGDGDLRTYLRSLYDAKEQYVAKLLLAGEGNVGKSTLIAALRGEPFQENRPTTHGIELSTLHIPHPTLPVDITLNSWDFGGQAIYRVTHQFFFSRRALYLLVWRPREGIEENALDGWLRRIRLRVGDEARVLIVATHADEGRSADIDFTGLQKLFPHVLVDHLVVDSKSRMGIDNLKKSIANASGELPQMGEKLSRRWAAARDDVLKSANPQIGYDEFVSICAGHGLTPPESRTLANLLHDLGHLIYYGDDDGLKNIVVLKPEWLTKAIGYVLEDQETQRNGGELSHHRLIDIWANGNERNHYPPKYHPYFLRLMEKFDVSYRLPDSDASLVAQLVPFSRPALPWDSDPSGADVGKRILLAFIDMSDVAPGLIAWLTVRNHRFSAGLHWRTGVFLQHKQYTSEGLVELDRSNHRRLRIEVRAPSPDYFFSVLRDSVEELLKRRWPGLRYNMAIPCRNLAIGGSCAGTFNLNVLLSLRERGETEILCHECITRQDISELLTGFSSRDPNAQLTAVMRELGEVTHEVRRVASYTATVANQVRSIMTAVSSEVPDCPRLFTLESQVPWNKLAKIWRSAFDLTLWCEQPGGWHSWPEATYRVKDPKEWVKRAAPYINIVVSILKLAVPIATGVSGLAVSDIEYVRIERQLDFMNALAEALPERNIDPENSFPEGAKSLTPLEGAGLRMFRSFMQRLDPSSGFGGLRRVQDATGDYIWVCPHHYRLYDPGLPQLPGTSRDS